MSEPKREVFVVELYIPDGIRDWVVEGYASRFEDQANGKMEALCELHKTNKYRVVKYIPEASK